MFILNRHIIATLKHLSKYLRHTFERPRSSISLIINTPFYALNRATVVWRGSKKTDVLMDFFLRYACRNYKCKNVLVTLITIYGEYSAFKVQSRNSWNWGQVAAWNDNFWSGKFICDETPQHHSHLVIKVVGSTSF